MRRRVFVPEVHCGRCYFCLLGALLLAEQERTRGHQVCRRLVRSLTTPISGGKAPTQEDWAVKLKDLELAARCSDAEYACAASATRLHRTRPLALAMRVSALVSGFPLASSTVDDRVGDETL